MEWPRDADRLPNGHTLITDTNRDRVFEVNQRNEIVWEATFPGPYEAERLSTGDESTGGQSAATLGLASLDERGFSNQNNQQYSLSQRLVYGFIDLLPTKLVHGLLYLLPA